MAKVHFIQALVYKGFVLRLVCPKTMRMSFWNSIGKMFLVKRRTLNLHWTSVISGSAWMLILLYTHIDAKNADEWLYIMLKIAALLCAAMGSWQKLQIRRRILLTTTIWSYTAAIKCSRYRWKSIQHSSPETVRRNIRRRLLAEKSMH